MVSHHHCCAGIIPARAGSTAPSRPTGASARDHPRSRGVYSHRSWPATRTRGSSPLARGLPAAVTGKTVIHRIIPARAGFTPPASLGLVVRGDHPRSRGVYTHPLECDRWCVGSSPLARGLRDAVPAPAAANRIIPARAGFTCSVMEWWWVPLDHPRSRGVYAAVVPVGQATPGIIPARAGFTRRDVARRSRWTDHPRSRGVYVSAFPPATAFRGSSPLARGLRDRPVMTGHEGGIIPARAGFTPGPVGQRHLRGDHPRSRGVYSSTGSSRFPSAGSSPLARGLRQAHTRRLPRERIIPARAGFTPPGVSSRTSPRDHPRSRGVYSRSVRHSLVLSGSSPLARGLLLGT